MRPRDVVLSLASLALVGAGIALISTFFLRPGASGSNTSEESGNFEVPVLQEGTQATEEAVQSGPADKTLRLTIPKMARISNSVVPDAAGDNEDKLKNYAAIHLEGTGFPWEKGSNVYIAGHRLGFPDYASFLAFYDLDALQKGDEIVVTDAAGGQYTYRVFEGSVVGPSDLSVTKPIEGKDVLTLQTCTLPDYTQRLIVQAEKVA